jgi:hypothetical protein
MRRPLALAFLIPGLLLLAFGPVYGLLRPHDPAPQFHTAHERGMLRQLTVQQNDLFGGSGLCAGCHGHDPAGLAGVLPNGLDVNVVDHWKATMMANSAKDPLWRAKVSHEILVNPSHSVQLQNKCTSCHAPQGRFNAAHHGLDYGLADLVTDSLGLDGVGCGACHQQDPQFVGKFFSGNLVYDTTKTVWGPYVNPFQDPMQDFIGFNVLHGAHVRKSELCAGCHTLITETVDLSGVPTGSEFVEQATYHEWLNSRYADNQDNISCQACHVPSINENVIIAANYNFLGPRRPFGLHHMVGGNTFMLRLMKTNRVALGLSASDVEFDSTIARTEKMLANQTAELTLTEASRTSDTVFYTLDVHNLAGHKFPSGYPSRRAWIQFVVMDDAGDTLFASGTWDGTEISGHDPVWEPHYNTIHAADQVQIYEMVLGDINGNRTTVLERAHHPLKDNRLAPEGFSTGHPAYDTTQIAGNALTDPDFNWNGAVEGTGADVVHYNVPLNGYTGGLNVVARLYYQSVPERWLNEMFAFSSAEISTFQSMFGAADKSPFKVAQAVLGDMFVAVDDADELSLSVFPNPARGVVFLKNVPDGVTGARLFSVNGQLLSSYSLWQLQMGWIDLSEHHGTLLLVLDRPSGAITRRIIAL